MIDVEGELLAIDSCCGLVQFEAYSNQLGQVVTEFTIREGEVERETGFEPATFCLGSRHSAS